MPGPPLSAAARGTVRDLERRFKTEAEAVTEAARRLPSAMLAATQQRCAVSRRRAMAHVQKRLPIQPVYLGAGQAGWRFLAPLASPQDIGLLDAPTLAVMALLLGARGRPLLSIETFGLCFAAYGLGRFVERSAGADPARAMLTAHDALLKLSPTEGTAVYRLARVPLPAGPGCFLAHPVPQAGDRPPMAICVTWISNDQTFEDQDEHLAAWQEVMLDNGRRR